MTEPFGPWRDHPPGSVQLLARIDRWWLQTGRFILGRVLWRIVGRRH